MPRKSTVEELQNEELVAGSPVRRSSRLVTTSGNGTQRSSQASDPPGRITRARRASEEVESKPAPRTRRASILAEEEQSSTPVRRGRKPSVTKESEDQEETTVKPKPVLRGRRASNASVEDPEEKPQKAAVVRTRRGSANVESEPPAAAKTPAKLTGRRRSSASEVIVVEEESTPARRTTRSRKNSDVVEIVEDTKPATRGRRRSITQEEETKVEELRKPVARRGRRTSTDSLVSDPGPGTPSRRITRRSSVNQEEETVAEVNNAELSPVIKEVSVRITPFKKRGIIEQVEADLDLSIINESVSDDANTSVESKSELENKLVSPASRKRLSTIDEIGTPPRKSPRLSGNSSPSNRKLDSSERINSPTNVNLHSPEISPPKVRTPNSSSQIIINQETHVSTTTQIVEEKLNTSSESVGSNKENLIINEIVEKSSPIARVSNVFKPNQREYSFMEPMEVDETINQSLLEKMMLDKSSLASDSPLAKENIVADSTNSQEQKDTPILKKLSVVLYHKKLAETKQSALDMNESLNEEKIVADSTSNQKTEQKEAFSAIDATNKLKSVTRSEDSDLIDFAETDEVNVEETEVDESLVVFGEEPSDPDLGGISVTVIREDEETGASEVNLLQPKVEVEEVSIEAPSEASFLNEDVQIKEEIVEIETVQLLDRNIGATKEINENSLVNNEITEIGHLKSPVDSRRKSLRKSKSPQVRNKDEDGDKVCIQIKQKTPQKEIVSEVAVEADKECSEPVIEGKSDKDLNTSKKLEDQNVANEDSEEEDVNTNNKNEAREIETANEDVEMDEETIKQLKIKKLEISKELFDDSEDEDDDTNGIKKAKEDKEKISGNGNEAEDTVKKLNIRKLEVQKELFDDDSEDDDDDVNKINKSREIDAKGNEIVKEIELTEDPNIKKLEISKELFDDDSEDEDDKTGGVEKPEEDKEQVSENGNEAVNEIEMAEETINKKLEVQKELFDADSEDEDTNNTNEAGDIEKASEDIEQEVAEEDEEKLPENGEAVEEIEVAEEAKEQAEAGEATILSNKTPKKATPVKEISKTKRSLDEFASAKLMEYFESKRAYIENSSDEEESGKSGDECEEEDNSFIDGMAEEGEEDTPSEDSNQIIDQGESIGSSDSIDVADDEQSIDENDSFICDDEEPVELLSGEEYDLDIEEETKKKSRIRNNEELGDEEIIKIPEKKEKGKRILTRIITVSSSSEEESGEICDLVAEEDNLELLDKENIQENETNQMSNDDVDQKLSIDENRPPLDSTTDEHNDSKADEVRRSLNALNQSRHRKSSLSIQENIFLDGSKDPRLRERINSLVESFCSNVKKGEVSLNLSLEFEDNVEEEDTTKNVNIISDVTIQKETTDIIDDEQEDIPSMAGPSEVVENIADQVEEEENIIIPPEGIFVNIEEIIPADDSTEIEELNKSAQQVDLREVINKKLKRRLSKSLSEVYEETKKAKKRKKNNGKAKPRPNLAEYLGADSFGLMNQLITDVKNRPRRKIKPSSSAVVNESWTSTVVSNLKPSTSVLKEEKKPVPKPKLHPKDFKNQMLTDPKRVRRVETKSLLRKKGAFF